MKESNQPSVEGKSVGASPITSAIFSRCRLAAMAAGLHPAQRGCESLHLDQLSLAELRLGEPLPGSSTVERPFVKRRDVGANPTPAAISMRCACSRPDMQASPGATPGPTTHSRRSVRGACVQRPKLLGARPQRQKGQRHDRCCPRGRVDRGCRSRADCTGRLRPPSADRLKTENNPGPEGAPPGRFNFHARVWCQGVGDSPRKGDHAGASPVTLTNFVAVSSNQQDRGL